MVLPEQEEWSITRPIGAVVRGKGNQESPVTFMKEEKNETSSTTLYTLPGAWVLLSVNCEHYNIIC
jgi:hypothetical protein